MEITSLNQQRKHLLQELHTLKNYREYCIHQTQQKISEIKLDYSDKYFALDGEFSGKSFQERFATTLSQLVTDVHENEDVLGVRLDDLDEEIDRIFKNLAKKEKEFEELEKEMRKPLKEKKAFQVATEAFLKEIPDLHNSLDYVELQEVIERKELFDNLLQDIVQERETQLQQEIQKIQEDYQQNRLLQKIVYFNLEQHSSTINTALKTKHQENYENIFKKKEALFDQFIAQEKDRHRHYGLKYQKIYDESQVQSEESIQKEIEKSWKYDLLQDLDQMVHDENDFREEQQRLDALLIQYLNKRDQIHHFSSSTASGRPPLHHQLKK